MSTGVPHSSGCIFVGCRNDAYYAYAGELKPKYCHRHADEDMDNIVNLNCAKKGCDETNPTYRFIGKVGRYCKKHKKTGMVSVGGTLCIAVGCGIVASFADNIGDIALYCAAHSTLEMVNVRQPFCIISMCESRAQYSLLPAGKLEFCVEHKENGMFRRYGSNICVECSVKAQFSLKGEFTPTHCATHAKRGMIAITSQRYCIFGGKGAGVECRSVASFSATGKCAVYCSLHKLDGMMHIKTKECLFDGCSIQPSFGVPGGNAQYCETHMLDSMVNVKKPRCSVKGCVEVGDFTAEVDVDNKKRIKYCVYHKTPGMVNFVTIKRLMLKERKRKEDGKSNRKRKRNKNCVKNNKKRKSGDENVASDSDADASAEETNWLDAEEFISPYDDDLINKMQLKSNKRRLLVPL